MESRLDRARLVDNIAIREPEAEAAATSPVDISVVIPVYNEEERIVNTVSLLTHHLRKRNRSYEVIISDDGSHDESPELVEKIFSGVKEVRLIREMKNRGKGAAVRKGILAARGGYVIFTDADLSYPLETIDHCLKALGDHDIAVGSRNLPESNIEVEPTWLRRLTGPVFKGIVRSLVIRGFTDTQCGFKGFRSQAAHDIFLNCSINGFAFDVEVLSLALQFGYSVTEIPVRLQVDSSDSQINLTTDPLKMIIDLLHIRRKVKTMRDGNGS